MASPKLQRGLGLGPALIIALLGPRTFCEAILVRYNALYHVSASVIPILNMMKIEIFSTLPRRSDGASL